VGGGSAAGSGADPEGDGTIAGSSGTVGTAVSSWWTSTTSPAAGSGSTSASARCSGAGIAGASGARAGASTEVAPDSSSSAGPKTVQPRSPAPGTCAPAREGGGAGLTAPSRRVGVAGRPSPERPSWGASTLAPPPPRAPGRKARSDARTLPSPPSGRIVATAECEPTDRARIPHWLPSGLMSNWLVGPRRSSIRRQRADDPFVMRRTVPARGTSLTPIASKAYTRLPPSASRGGPPLPSNGNVG
jgi:hypothetical protein